MLRMQHPLGRQERSAWQIYQTLLSYYFLVGSTFYVFKSIIVEFHSNGGATKKMSEQHQTFILDIIY